MGSFLSTLTRFSLILFVLALMSGAALADDRLVLGGDAYVFGSHAALADPSPRNAFLSGFSASLTGKVEKDANATGFDVDIEAPVGRNLQAAGASVEVAQPIGEDVSAAGFNLHIRKEAEIGGNARLVGGNIVLDAPVSGSVLAAAGSLLVNGTIAGDARLTAGKLAFGPNAQIGGILTYYATEPIEIAPSVAPKERIRFERLERAGPPFSYQETMGHAMPRLWPSFFSLFFSLALSVLFLVAVAGFFLAVTPKLTEDLKGEALAAPFRSIGLGILGLSMLVGLVPVSGMTLIGIPLIPIVILAIIALWILGYLLGAYALAMRIAGAFGEIPATITARLVVVAVGLIIIVILNFIPILGWLINLIIVFLGLGAMVTYAARVIADRQGVGTISQVDAKSPSASEAGADI